MFTKSKMQECMKGDMSMEEKMKVMGKMMDRFFSQEKTEEAKTEESGKAKAEKTECCPDMEKVFDLCSSMIGQRTANGGAQDKGRSGTKNGGKSEETGCCPDMTGATESCKQMMETILAPGKEKKRGEETP